MVCSEDIRVYTGSDGTSLRLELEWLAAVWVPVGRDGTRVLEVGRDRARDLGQDGNRVLGVGRDGARGLGVGRDL